MRASSVLAALSCLICIATAPGCDDRSSDASHTTVASPTGSAPPSQSEAACANIAAEVKRHDLEPNPKMVGDACIRQMRLMMIACENPEAVIGCFLDARAPSPETFTETFVACSERCVRKKRRDR